MHKHTHTSHTPSHLEPKWTVNPAFVKGSPSCARSGLQGPRTNKLSWVFFFLNKALSSSGFKYTLALLPHWFQYTSGSSVWSRAAAHMVPAGLG